MPPQPRVSVWHQRFPDPKGAHSVSPYHTGLSHFCLFRWQVVVSGTWVNVWWILIFFLARACVSGGWERSCPFRWGVPPRPESDGTDRLVKTTHPPLLSCRCHAITGPAEAVFRVCAVALTLPSNGQWMHHESFTGLGLGALAQIYGWMSQTCWSLVVYLLRLSHKLLNIVLFSEQ